MNPSYIAKISVFYYSLTTVKKVLLFTFLGFGLFIGGIGVAFFYFQGAQDGSRSGLLLIPAVLLGGAGSFFLFKAGRIDTQKVVFKENQAQSEGISSEGLITKNNKLVEEWNKTNEKRDKLKMIELSANEQTEAAK